MIYDKKESKLNIAGCYLESLEHLEGLVKRARTQGFQFIEMDHDQFEWFKGQNGNNLSFNEWQVIEEKTL